jgi:hypothetical protein
MLFRLMNMILLLVVCITASDIKPEVSTSLSVISPLKEMVIGNYLRSDTPIPQICQMIQITGKEEINADPLLRMKERNILILSVLVLHSIYLNDNEFFIKSILEAYEDGDQGFKDFLDSRLDLPKSYPKVTLKKYLLGKGFIYILIKEGTPLPFLTELLKNLDQLANDYYPEKKAQIRKFLKYFPELRPLNGPLGSFEYQDLVDNLLHTDPPKLDLKAMFSFDIDFKMFSQFYRQTNMVKWISSLTKLHGLKLGYSKEELLFVAKVLKNFLLSNYEKSRKFFNPLNLGTLRGILQKGSPNDVEDLLKMVSKNGFFYAISKGDFAAFENLIELMELQHQVFTLKDGKAREGKITNFLVSLKLLSPIKKVDELSSILFRSIFLNGNCFYNAKFIFEMPTSEKLLLEEWGSFLLGSKCRFASISKFGKFEKEFNKMFEPEDTRDETYESTTECDGSFPSFSSSSKSENPSDGGSCHKKKHFECKKARKPSKF